MAPGRVIANAPPRPFLAPPGNAKHRDAAFTNQDHSWDRAVHKPA